jgi:transcriptional regulator with XRE-family HTH domain
MIDWGGMLRQLRLESGRTQGQVAEAMGATAAYLSNLERQRGHPSLDLLGRLAEVYGVPLERLLLEAITLDDMKALDATDRRHYRLLRHAMRDAYPVQELGQEEDP